MRCGLLTSTCPPRCQERNRLTTSLILGSLQESKLRALRSIYGLTDFLLSFTYSFWARGIPGCGSGAQERFKETLELFFEAVNIQARAREEGIIPDLESYIDIRRDTSGKLAISFIEHLCRTSSGTDDAFQGVSHAGRS